jgi:hypothetical protein
MYGGQSQNQIKRPEKIIMQNIKIKQKGISVHKLPTCNIGGNKILRKYMFKSNRIIEN